MIDVDVNSGFKMVEGMEDMQKDKAIYAGIRKALGVIRSKGRTLLKERTKGHGRHPGLLSRAIAINTKRNRLGGLVGFKKVNFDGRKAYPYHAHLVNRGTNDRYTKGGKSVKKGAFRGRTRATRFWDDAPQGVESQMSEKLEIGIRKAIDRINRR